MFSISREEMNTAYTISESYDKVAAEYSTRIANELAGKPLDRAVLQAFAEQVGMQARICDIGCGPGHVSAFLHAAGVSVEGIDLSGGMIAQARHRYPMLTFTQGDMRSLAYANESFGGIVAFYSIIHLTAEELVLTFEEWRRILRTSGSVLIAFHVGNSVVHFDEWWDQPVDLDFHYLDIEEVTTTLQKAKFTVEAILQRAPYPEIEHQSQRAYMLARKQG